jgi:predicted house-cleaning noncanonical NTP pyrophosphatase (MazG superfamily)
VLKIHNKAIRDKIPEIIKKSGHDFNTKTLSDDDFLASLEEKLVEELGEYQKSKSIEELADILEVIYRISELKGTTKEQLEEIRQNKSKERGAFKDNLYLIDTTD